MLKSSMHLSISILLHEPNVWETAQTIKIISSMLTSVISLIPFKYSIKYSSTLSSSDRIWPERFNAIYEKTVARMLPFFADLVFLNSLFW